MAVTVRSSSRISRSCICNLILEPSLVEWKWEFSLSKLRIEDWRIEDLSCWGLEDLSCWGLEDLSCWGLEEDWRIVDSVLLVVRGGIQSSLLWEVGFNPHWCGRWDSVLLVVGGGIQSSLMWEVGSVLLVVGGEFSPEIFRIFFGFFRNIFEF